MVSTFFRVIIPVSFACAFIGCEGYACAEGEVRDMETNALLDSVRIEAVTSLHDTLYTDASGRFDVCNPLSRCTFGCDDDILVVFWKDGYRPVSLLNPARNTIVYMERK